MCIQKIASKFSHFLCVQKFAISNFPFSHFMCINKFAIYNFPIFCASKKFPYIILPFSYFLCNQKFVISNFPIFRMSKKLPFLYFPFSHFLCIQKIAIQFFPPGQIWLFFANWLNFSIFCPIFCYLAEFIYFPYIFSMGECPKGPDMSTKGTSGHEPKGQVVVSP